VPLLESGKGAKDLLHAFLASRGDDSHLDIGARPGMACWLHHQELMPPDYMWGYSMFVPRKTWEIFTTNHGVWSVKGKDAETGCQVGCLSSADQQGNGWSFNKGCLMMENCI
jgi:hypothetical protein